MIIVAVYCSYCYYDDDDDDDLIPIVMALPKRS